MDGLDTPVRDEPEASPGVTTTVSSLISSSKVTARLALSDELM
jgi:hypothetical protein